jgi:phosphate transport system substrate-binding protein
MNKIKYLQYFTALRFGAAFSTAIWAMVGAGTVHAADTLTIAATGTAMPMLKILIDDFTKRSPDFKAILLYPPAGSGGAIRGVATGKVDLGVTSRVPKPDAPGSDLRAVPWVRTAFVITANHVGVARNYTLPELAAIWSGATLRWADGQPMRLLLRSADDADLASLRAMSAEMSRAVDAAILRPGLPRAEHDLNNLEILEKVSGAIGSSTLGLLLSSNSRLSVLTVGGVTPSVRTLKDQTYPYQRTLYLVSAPQINSPFIDFLRSARAQALLETNGFIMAAP